VAPSPSSPSPPPPLTILLNGERRPLPRAMSVRELLDELDLPEERVAVELNRRILKRAEFEDARVADGDELEVVTFVGGG